MSAFTDFLALQRDLAHLLLSDPWLQDVNIVLRHELLEPSSLARLPDKTLAAETLVYTTSRSKGGRRGCGIIVERPEFSVLSPNVTGPQGDIICEFFVVSDRFLNDAPQTGTLRLANHVAQRIVDLLHLQPDDGVGTYRAEGVAIQPDRDWEPLDAWRVRLSVKVKRIQTPRCAPVVASIADNVCTLTCATSGADIWYTLSAADADGNEIEPGPPCPSNSHGGAALYSSAVTLSANQILRAAAYKATLNQSAITRKVNS